MMSNINKTLVYKQRILSRFWKSIRLSSKQSIMLFYLHALINFVFYIGKKNIEYHYFTISLNC